MLNHVLKCCCLLLLHLPAFGQIDRIDPPNWWVSMKSKEVQLLVYGEGIGNAAFSMKPYQGVSLKSTEKVSNPNYLFLNLEIGEEATPGELKFTFKLKGKNVKYAYSLLARKNQEGRIQGLDGSDLLYLIMPDRFANGNPENDLWDEAQEKALSRDSLKYRHGGDLKGIIDHLPYIDDLGVTALWINPVFENNEPKESYHGYAITDHYNTDPRLGTLDEYQQLVDDCHARGMKLVKDVVYNHVGDQHYLFKDLPDPSWVNQHDEFTRTTYRAPTLLDPHASQADKDLMAKGWFDHHMPDLDQTNPMLANYLIQNTIWWVEKFGIDAYRIDTYAYPDQRFMSDLVKAVRDEYPQFFLFGETWVHGLPVQAYFTEKSPLNKDFDSHLHGVTDFQLYHALCKGLNEDFGWTSGMNRLYYALAKDGMYHDPAANVTFLDNHDLSRFYSVLNEDMDKLKMALSFLMTTRGIPQLYYGTEILLKNNTWPNDGMVRQDFPGGWAGDKTDKFSAEGRTTEEEAIFQHVRTLARWRKTNSAVQTGALMQFVPEKGVYTYFRYDAQGTVMVIMNQNAEAKAVKTDRFAERMDGFSSGTDVLSGKAVSDLSSLTVEGKSALVLELVR